MDTNYEQQKAVADYLAGLVYERCAKEERLAEELSHVADTALRGERLDWSSSIFATRKEHEMVIQCAAAQARETAELLMTVGVLPREQYGEVMEVLCRVGDFYDRFNRKHAGIVRYPISGAKRRAYKRLKRAAAKMVRLVFFTQEELDLLAEAKAAAQRVQARKSDAYTAFRYCKMQTLRGIVTMLDLGVKSSTKWPLVKAIVSHLEGMGAFKDAPGRDAKFKNWRGLAYSDLRKLVADAYDDPDIDLHDLYNVACAQLLWAAHLRRQKQQGIDPTASSDDA